MQPEQVAGLVAGAAEKGMVLGRAEGVKVGAGKGALFTLAGVLALLFLHAHAEARAHEQAVS